MYAETQPSLGDILPSFIALGIAFAVAKSISFFGVVTTKNVNKWAIFCASLTGIAYAIYMMPHIKIKNEFFYFIAPFIFAIFGGFISWILYYFAFANVAKKDDK